MKYIVGIYDCCDGCDGLKKPRSVEKTGPESIRADYWCDNCYNSWYTSWQYSFEAVTSPQSQMPARSGRSIVVPDGEYDYWCDLERESVEWWIRHLSEKNWWQPRWAPVMRDLAGRA